MSALTIFARPMLGVEATADGFRALRDDAPPGEQQQMPCVPKSVDEH